jgi:hypothetical protein
MLGVLLTKWTIRLALACYVAYLAGWLVSDSPRWSKTSRWLWSLGCGLFLVHVLCAFQFYHHWSHAAAWQTTAEETQKLMGVSFGDGIYFSYVFAATWLADVVWLWVAALSPTVPGRQVRTPWTRVLVHVYLFFIAFNGAIVFEGGVTRWAGLAACLVLACLAARRLYNSGRARSADSPRETAPKPILTSDS